MAIQMRSTTQIPQRIRQRLRRFNSVLARCELAEQLLEDDNLHRIALELNGMCLREGLVGYHYTRASHEKIADRGLQLSCGADRRQKFMSEYGHLFSEAQRKRIKKMWCGYFDVSQNYGRDNRIWFNCTLNALKGRGADRLLAYFGGESIYMPLTQNNEIAAVLKTIGQPLIVEVELQADKLHTFSNIPWGTIWLSSYHVSVNQKAQQHDVDAYVMEPVMPANIVSISVVNSKLVKGDGVKAPG